MRLEELKRPIRGKLSVAGRDENLMLQKIVTGRRNFWAATAWQNEAELLVYLIAQQDWVLDHNPGMAVRPGDIVLDCGAHVGTFTSKALELGAAKVVVDRA